MYHPIRGNILFIILLAVVLFAALSYAVTSSLRGGGKDSGSEKASLIAAEIINYTTQMEQTVTRLRLVNNCKLSEISFENSISAVNYTNTAAPRADKSCNIFDINGGAMSWKEVPESWLVSVTEAASYAQTNYPSTTFYKTFNFPNNVCIKSISGSNCINGTSNEKALMINSTFLRKDICDAINAQLGSTTNTTIYTCSPAGDTGSFYKGTFYNSGGYLCPLTDGRRSGCVYTNRTGYTFWHVLEAQ